MKQLVKDPRDQNEQFLVVLLSDEMILSKVDDEILRIDMHHM